MVNESNTLESFWGICWRLKKNYLTLGEHLYTSHQSVSVKSSFSLCFLPIPICSDWSCWCGTVSKALDRSIKECFHQHTYIHCRLPPSNPWLQWLLSNTSSQLDELRTQLNCSRRMTKLSPEFIGPWLPIQKAWLELTGKIWESSSLEPLNFNIATM